MSSPRSFYSSIIQPIAHAGRAANVLVSDAASPTESTSALPDRSRDPSAQDWPAMDSHQGSSGMPNYTSLSVSDETQGLLQTVPGLSHVDTELVGGDAEGELVMREFHEQCHRRGFLYDYHIFAEDANGFDGILDVAQQRIAADGRLPTKKAVKKSLAAKGLILLSGMDVPTSHKPVSGVNWIGRLQEHLAQLEPGRQADYSFESVPPSSFTCTVKLPVGYLKSPNVISSGTSFLTKKAAKTAAAEAALSALARAGVISPTGLSPMVTLPGLPAAVVYGQEPEQTYCQKFSAFCLTHGYAPPRYDLQANNNHYSGSVFVPHALVAGADKLPEGGPLGRVQNIFGRQKAKEALARQVLPDLEQKLQEMLGRVGTRL